ncbi:MAG: hypothetical protein ABIT01_09765 [Thermoanaerobaculia bacterium]
MVMPLAGKFFRRSRAVSVTSSINRQLSTARLEAVRRGVQVVVEISTIAGPDGANQIHLKTFSDNNPDFVLGTYTPAGGGPAKNEAVLGEINLDPKIHIWKYGGTIDDMSTGVLWNTYNGSGSLQNRIVFLPTGALTPPQAGNSGPPSSSSGRGIYFADASGSPAVGKNYFRVTIYSDIVARPRIEKYVNSSVQYATTGWTWL